MKTQHTKLTMFMCLIGALGILSFPANAAGLPPIKDIDVDDSSISIDSYAIEGSKAVIINDTIKHDDIPMCDTATTGITCSDLIPIVQRADINCNGAGATGGWTGSVSSPDPAKLCWSSLTISYAGDAPGEIITKVLAKGSPEERFIPTAKLDIKRNLSIGGTAGATHFSKCADPAVSAGAGNGYKEYCVWDATDGTTPLEQRLNNSVSLTTVGSKITGATTDDMIKLPQDTAAYFEYVDLGESSPDNLKLIYRDTTGSTTNDMMVPAGPKPSALNPAGFGDFRNFVNNSPSDVTILDACYPMSAEIRCDGAEEFVLPVPGKCGTAHTANGLIPAATYNTIADLPLHQRCLYGKAADLDDTGPLGITWKCEGTDGGAIKECLHSKKVNAQCGSSTHLQKFANITALNNNGEFCSAGSYKVSGPDGNGPWTWTCKSNHSGADIPEASCAAFKEGQVCTHFFENENMVIAQDLSRSFRDDLSNTSAALKSLLNNSAFKTWNVGLTSTSGTDGSSSVYSKRLSWTAVETGLDTITNQIDSYSTRGSEDPLYAIHRSIQDYFPRTDGEAGTIVMITDEEDANRENLMSTIANQLKNNDLRLVILATSNVTSYYQSLINAQGIGNIASVETITSNSDNLAAALLNGLTEVSCD